MQDIFDLIDEDELLDIFSKAVDIKSTNPKGNEKPMCEYVESLLKQNGIEYFSVPVEEGRYDIIAEPRNKNKRGFVIECKIVKDEKDLEKMSKEAIEQIKNKKYDTQLKERGIKEITLLGLAFCGKRMKVSSE